MADMIAQYRVMPEDGDIEYDVLESKVKEVVESYGDSVVIKEIGSVEVGFGLQAVRVKFQMDETLGLDNLEEKLSSLEEVGELNVELMDRL